MDSEKNIVEINGRKYDAKTGKPVSDSPASSFDDPHQAIADILSGEALTQETVNKIERKLKKARQPSPKVVSDIKRRPEKSSTLMRPAVKKPTLKSTAVKNPGQSPRIKTTPRDRLRRARTVQKSHHIKKFHRSHVPVPVAIKTERLEVKQQPAVNRPEPVHPKNEWPVIDQFEKAMQEASSHLETFAGKPTRSKKKRKLAYGLASLSVIAVIGFGIYSALPIAKVKMAGSKAGFSAELPSYNPSGYGLADPIKADYGQVTLSYKSRTDDKGFNITQEPSQWNSQSLVNNFLVSSNKDYQTVKGAGHTIYTYDNTDATWVDGGIWYKVEGNANLSDEQLIKIANSL